MRKRVAASDGRKQRGNQGGLTATVDEDLTYSWRKSW